MGSMFVYKAGRALNCIFLIRLKIRLLKNKRVQKEKGARSGGVRRGDNCSRSSMNEKISNVNRQVNLCRI